MIEKQVSKRRRQRQGGSVILEFAIMSWVLVYLGVGVAIIGMNLDRQLAVTHLSRYAADLMRADANLVNANVQNVLLKSARGLRMTNNGGESVIILSKLERCASGNNAGQTVVTRRIQIGNPQVHSSAIGTPSVIGGDGTVYDYQSDASARAVLPNGTVLQVGQDMVVAEVYARGSDIRFPGIVDIQNFKSVVYY